MPERWVTFDCYDTLIDWNRGIGDTLAGLWPQTDPAVLLETYHQVEPLVQSERPRPYREVLGLCTERVAGALDLPVAPGAADALADSSRTGPPFPEVPAALRELRDDGWRLGILSNTDPDFLASSLAALSVAVDMTVTFVEAESYKPAPGHWLAYRPASRSRPTDTSTGRPACSTTSSRAPNSASPPSGSTEPPRPQTFPEPRSFPTAPAWLPRSRSWPSSERPERNR